MVMIQNVPRDQQNSEAILAPQSYTLPSSTSTWLKAIVTGETQPRNQLNSDGFSVGPGGSTAPDTQLKRFGANQFGGTSLQLVATSIGPVAAQQHTVPAVASDTIALLAATQTLTNKTITAPVLSGTATGTYTLGGTPTISSTAAFTNASPFSVANAQTLTVSVTAQTVGAATLTVPNFAGVADTFAFTTLIQTLVNKTLTNPFIGTVIGGSGVASSLALKSTSGIGSSDAIVFLVGNNGGTEAGRFLTGGQFQMGLSASQIIPGATSFALRNNGNTVNNLLLSDAGNITIIGTGPHAFGAATDSNTQIQFRGTFVDTGGTPTIFLIHATLNPAATRSAFGLQVQNTINIAASGTHTNFAGTDFVAPTIGAGAGTLTNASTVKIEGAPTGASNNYSFWIAAGIQRFDGSSTTGTDNAAANSTLTSGQMLNMTLSGTSVVATAANTGSIASFVSTSTGFSAATQSLVTIRSSGTNVTTGVTVQALNISIVNTRTTSTNIGLNIAASGASTNYAMQLGGGNINVNAATTILTPSVLTINAFTLGGTLTIGDFNIALSAVTGTQIGTAITQKMGFYGTTPIAQRAGAAQTAVATTGSTSTTPFGYTTAAQADAIVTLVNELRAWAVAQGFIKGAA